MLPAVVAFAAAKCVGEGLRGLAVTQHWQQGSAAQRAAYRSMRDNLGTMSHFPSHLYRTSLAVLGSAASTDQVGPPPSLRCIAQVLRPVSRWVLPGICQCVCRRVSVPRCCSVLMAAQWCCEMIGVAHCCLSLFSVV